MSLTAGSPIAARRSLSRNARRIAVLALSSVIAATSPLAQGSDLTPPSVIARSPAAGATGVSALVTIRAVFSEPIQPATLSMALRNSTNQVIAAQVSYDADTQVAILDPNNDLTGNEQFTVTVSGARDAAGNLMIQDSWAFTTAVSQFSDQVLPQLGLTEPTVVRFAADGRIFVAQKDGRIWTYDDLSDASATLVADLRQSVYNFWDRGMLGMTLHPDFPNTPYLYALYTFDAVPGGTAPRWGSAPFTDDPCPSPPGPTGNGCVVTGRLTRLVLDNPAEWPLLPADEQVLVTDWPQQFPSHSTGALTFGSDGALYASGGDGASFTFADYGQTPSSPPLNDPPNEGGALRSQDIRTTADPTGLNGTVIRIDPVTGAALPDNPRFSTDPDPNGRRIVANGFRNPFRIANRPGTREIWIGDVGWSHSEEINRLIDPIDAAVDNFGWPCYEGIGRQGSYDSLNLPVCEGLYTPGDVAVVRPVFDYLHNEVVRGCSAAGGSAVAGLAFYPTTGGAYPTSYAGALFFADYSRSCIWAMRAGADGVPSAANLDLILDNSAGPVDLVSGPGGDIFYPGFNDHRLHRLRFAGNLPPDAAVTASQTSGTSPLTVSFSAAGSFDPEGQALSYAWDLDGDGAFDDGLAQSAQWTYTSETVLTARVLVTDAAGLSDVAGIAILVDNSAPTAVIDAPTGSTTWKVGDLIAFSGRGVDPDQPGGLPASAMSWDVIMRHCPSDCHSHPIQTFAGVAGGSFVAPDHDYPSHLEIRLTVVDDTNLQGTVTVAVLPQTVDLTFQSNPPGLQIGVNAAAEATPFTRRVLVGSNNSLSAPTPQVLGGQAYSFTSWSDGGAGNHNVIAPAAATTYTATYSSGAPIAGLVAAYGMNEGSGSTIGDISGNSHTGTIAGATWNAQGRFGSALQFDGVNDLVTIADAAGLDLTASLTIEAWVNPTTLSGWRTVLLKEAPSGLAYALYAHDNGPRWAGYVNSGGGDIGALSGAALPANTWTHVAMTYDRTRIRIYQNGVEVGSRAHTAAVIATTGAVRIGGNTVWGEWFAGRIDELRIYNRALSAGEVAADMNTPVGGAPPPDTTDPTAVITAPAAGPVRGTVTVTASASDNVGVSSVQFLLDGAPLGAPDTTAPFTVAWDTTGAAAGPHTLSARAVDAAGNDGDAPPVTVIVDNNGPAVSITGPPHGATVGGVISVTASASDASGVGTVQFLLDGAPLGTADSSSPYSVSWNTAGSANGVHQLSAIATDSLGNQAGATPISVTVSNVVDVTPPSVAITSPAADATVSGTITIAASASDASGIASVEFFVNGVSLGTPDTTAPFSASWNTAPGGNGTRSLTARATDGVGLQTTSAAISVTVNNAWTVPAGLVAAYTFSEGAGATVADASGNGRTGTISGAAWTTGGRFGAGLRFDGVDDWVTVADANALDLTSGMTIEAWVNPSANGGWRTVAMKEATSGLAYALYSDDDVPSRAAGYVNRGSGDVAARSTGPVPLNTWTHLAVTYGGGSLRFYVNGALTSTVALTGNIRTTNRALRMGGNGVWGEFFAGILDEVRIYNRALTAAEIQSGMLQTLGAP